ncbi:MAG TPA: nickel-dependent lactate racemase, partial [Thermofilaceae archaeon]|nr:nickel-dependent lactate racemase [Thermofilaceae archaeon]
MQVAFPCGKERILVELPDETFVVQSKIPGGVSGELAERLVSESVKRPRAGPTLQSLLSGGEEVTILITDKTRATPNRVILRVLLEYLEEVAGVKRDRVEVLVATGLHEPHSASEIEELVGKDLASEYHVYSHDADDEESLTYLGTTSYGTEVYVNTRVVESDLVIGVGLIEPHLFAGYSGGRKMILPGVSGTKTVYQNHGFKMLAHPRADYGYLEGNPVHEDMVEASRMVKSYRYIVHVILDKEKRIVDVISGDPYESHLLGVKRLEEYVK